MTGAWMHKRAGLPQVAGEEVVGRDLLRPSELDERQIEELIAENLNQALQIVNEVELGHALHDFVEKVQPSLLSAPLKHETQRRTEGEGECAKEQHCLTCTQTGMETGRRVRTYFAFELP